MECVNHTGTPATLFCQNCGKPYCNECVLAGRLRTMPGGQVTCENCIAQWQNLHAPFAAPTASGPNPSAAAVLGFIPGVGAMYNAQYVKALVHVAIFVFLIYAADHLWYFVWFIPAWILYQVFDAYHTAKARRDGLPVPDPLGLNDLKFGFNVNVQPPATAAQEGTTDEQPYVAPSAPYIPPANAFSWNRPEPVGAIILIVLGIIFLLGEIDFFSMWVARFFWPVLLIALGVYLIVRRILCNNGGCQ